ncbi:MAG: flagellar basal body-associated FliL family protein [Desulfovibrionaceae bacterium]|nr:flagellar basal body-associated FliL family protein [Desulfovibrionaceae bacterium]MBF0512584.1 flagellar basal body-associated FliL family protein [Desulfovibrionaceae bacterium]
MAEAVAEEEGKKKSGLLKWIILVVLLLALGGGGFFAYTKFFRAPAPEAAPGAEPAPAVQEHAPPEAHGEAKKEEKSHEGKKEGEKGGKPVSLMVSLDPFVVNLADPPPARRYMKVRVDAEMVDEKAANEIKDKNVFIRDAIILLLSSKTSQDVSSMEGKLSMRKEIAEKINLTLEGPKVVRVYFSELVIQ